MVFGGRAARFCTAHSLATLRAELSVAGNVTAALGATHGR